MALTSLPMIPRMARCTVPNSLRSVTKDYFNEATSFAGKAFLVFSVPLAAKGTIKNIIRRIVGEDIGKVTIYFVSDLGIVEQI